MVDFHFDNYKFQKLVCVVERLPWQKECEHSLSAWHKIFSVYSSSTWPLFFKSILSYFRFIQDINENPLLFHFCYIKEAETVIYPQHTNNMKYISCCTVWNISKNGCKSQQGTWQTSDLYSIYEIPGISINHSSNKEVWANCEAHFHAECFSPAGLLLLLTLFAFGEGFIT